MKATRSTLILETYNPKPQMFNLFVKHSRVCAYIRPHPCQAMCIGKPLVALIAADQRQGRVSSDVIYVCAYAAYAAPPSPPHLPPLHHHRKCKD